MRTIYERLDWNRRMSAKYIHPSVEGPPVGWFKGLWLLVKEVALYKIDISKLLR